MPYSRLTEEHSSRSDGWQCAVVRLEAKYCGRRAADAPVVPLAWRCEPAMSPRLFKSGFKPPALDEPGEDLPGVTIQFRCQQCLGRKYPGRIADDVTHGELLPSLVALLQAAQAVFDRHNQCPRRVLSILGALAA